MESKCPETIFVIFMGQKEGNGPWLHLGGCPEGAQPTRARQEAQVGCAHLGGLPHRLFAL